MRIKRKRRRKGDMQRERKIQKNEHRCGTEL